MVMTRDQAGSSMNTIFERSVYGSALTDNSTADNCSGALLPYFLAHFHPYNVKHSTSQNTSCHVVEASKHVENWGQFIETKTIAFQCQYRVEYNAHTCRYYTQ